MHPLPDLWPLHLLPTEFAAKMSFKNFQIKLLQKYFSTLQGFDDAV